jgi:hypothetical protein
MRGDRDFDPLRAHDTLAREGDQSRESTPWFALVHAIQIDEEHWFAGTIRVRHARAQPAGDERQMGVRIPRFNGSLRGVEITSLFEAVVLIAGAFREERPDSVDVGRNVLRP